MGWALVHLYMLLKPSMYTFDTSPAFLRKMPSLEIHSVREILQSIHMETLCFCTADASGMNWV